MALHFDPYCIRATTTIHNHKICQRKVYTNHAISYTSTSLLLSNLHISWIRLTTYTQTL